MSSYIPFSILCSLQYICNLQGYIFCTEFNDVFVSNLEIFKENTINEFIWGNKFITLRQGIKKCVLLLRHWIRSGVSRISDLNFVNGKLDERYIHSDYRS